MQTFLCRAAAVLVAAGVAATTPAALADTSITGAGATFPFPFYQRAFYEYNKDHSDVTVNYQSIGSGGGIQQFTAKTVDFGASDVPMNSNELKAAVDSNGVVIQLPSTLGGEAIAYNVPGLPAHIKMNRDTLVAIYLGKITNWNDPAIAKPNPGVKFPSLPIVVAHRADGSGTTYIFTDFMSHISSEWKSKVGTSKTVDWPAASSVGGKGNEGVAGIVVKTPGAIGYLELAYVLQNDIAYAALQNHDGNYVLPSPDTILAAASLKPKVGPTDFSIVDEPGANSYGICGYSWIFLWKNQTDPSKGKQLVALWKWMVTGGQQYAANLKYVQLPKAVQDEALNAIGSVHN